MRPRFTREQDPADWCAVIAVFFLALAWWRLGIPSEIYFDEVHYVPAARKLIDGIRANPEHPLLGKTVIAAAIHWLGDKPLYWRLPNAFLCAFGLFAKLYQHRNQFVVIDDIGAGHMLLLATALAIGRPVLVIDVPAYRELVDAGANGWLVADNDATALATSMAAILKRPDLLVGMARVSRQKAERKIDQSEVWKPLFDIVGLADLRRKAA